MAVSVGIELNLKSIFSICGDLPYNLEYYNKSQTPIYWLEGQNDTYINQERKNSYEILQEIATDLNFKVVKNCNHTEIDEAFLEIEKVICNISS